MHIKCSLERNKSFVSASNSQRHVHEKNSFVEVSKNLVRYRSDNIFVIDHKNNYVA